MNRSRSRPRTGTLEAVVARDWRFDEMELRAEDPAMGHDGHDS
jgi:hypothetical protein